jgi:hypothetical protein
MYFACVAPLCICYFTNVAQNNSNCKHYFNYFPQCFQALSKFFAKSLFLLCSFSACVLSVLSAHRSVLFSILPV